MLSERLVISPVRLTVPRRGSVEGVMVRMDTASGVSARAGAAGGRAGAECGRVGAAAAGEVVRRQPSSASTADSTTIRGPDPPLVVLRESRRTEAAAITRTMLTAPRGVPRNGN